MAERGKKGMEMEIQKLEYLKNEKGLSKEIKSFFHKFFRAIIW